MNITVRVNLRIPRAKLAAARQAFRQNAGVSERVQTQWLARYSTFALKHFDLNSRGAGPENWPALAKSTLLARRGVRKKIARIKRLQRAVFRATGRVLGLTP